MSTARPALVPATDLQANQKGFSGWRLLAGVRVCGLLEAVEQSALLLVTSCPVPPACFPPSFTTVVLWVLAGNLLVVVAGRLLSSHP
jgi:hypothetical protein